MTKRGQESPTLHDLLHVTVFKRDFAGIQFLSRKVAVPTLLSTIHYLLLWMWRRGMEVAATQACGSLMGAQAWNNWCGYIIGVNTLLA